MGFGGLGGWYPHTCDEDLCFKVGDHFHDGKHYCKRHFFTVVKKLEECPGCLTTGTMHSNGLPCQSRAQCNLCKGSGYLEP